MMEHTESNYLKVALSHLEEMSTAGIVGQAVGNQYVAIAQIKLAQREYHNNQEQRDALLAAIKLIARRPCAGTLEEQRLWCIKHIIYKRPVRWSNVPRQDLCLYIARQAAVEAGDAPQATTSPQ